MQTLSISRNSEITLNIQQQPKSPEARSWAELVAELKRVANEGSRAFWRFWKGMTQEEKGVLLHGPEEEQVAVGR